MTNAEILFSLLRFEMCETPIDKETKNLITPELLPALYKLSKSHDMVHLVADALDKNGLLPDGTEAKKRFLQQRSMAIYRYEQINYELEEICRVLAEEKIEHIPLKGSVIRQYYPEPWMRTSCDIDLLVRTEKVDKAASLLQEKLHYKNEGKGPHDISLFSESGVHLELHYGTVEEGRAQNANEILSHIWETSEAENDAYRRVLSDEMFYFYHIAHMAKHFENGGCGIRPFLDIWILDEKIEHVKASRDELLKQGGLLTFAENARKLSKVWFLGEAHTELTRELENFILQGGVYGTVENRVAVQQTKKGGKTRYLFKRIFMPYQELKAHYPVIKKHKWLTPVFQIVRLVKFLFKGDKKRSLHEIKENATLGEEKKLRTAELLKKLEL